MSILYFTYSTVCSPTSSVSHCVNYYLNAYQYYYTMVLILIIIIFIIITSVYREKNIPIFAL